MDEIVTAMALDDMQAKDVAALGLDSLIAAAVGMAPSAAPEPGAKVDPAMEKAQAAEAAVAAAQKAANSVEYTHVVSAEMVVGGYDRLSFKAEQQDAFKAFVAKVTEAKNGAVKIENMATMSSSGALRRRLLAEAGAGKLKIGFSVQAKGQDAGAKAAAAINKLKDSPAAAVQGLKDAGLSAVTSAEVTKAAAVTRAVESGAATGPAATGSASPEEKEHDDKVKQAQDKVKEAKAAKAAAAATPRFLSPPARRRFGGRWRSTPSPSSRAPSRPIRLWVRGSSLTPPLHLLTRPHRPITAPPPPRPSTPPPPLPSSFDLCVVAPLSPTTTS